MIVLIVINASLSYVQYAFSFTTFNGYIFFMFERENLIVTLKKTFDAFIGILPVIIGMLLLTGLITKYMPVEKLVFWFGRNDWLDALIGSLLGSVSAGHPLTSYVLGGELLTQGVSLVAVAALIVSWVTVGIIQLPAEALMLGKRFALYRNLLSFLFAIVIAVLTVSTLGWLK